MVRDLLAIHDYLGDLERLRTRWASAAAAMRRLWRPTRSVVVYSIPGAGGHGAGGSATVTVTSLDRFVRQPDQSPHEQLAAQAEYLNRLRDWIIMEAEQRDQAIQAEREQTRTQLRAEREQLNHAIADARQEVDRLRELTTSGIGSRWVGVPVLLAGVAFSTWPDDLSEVWPAWLSAVALGFLVAYGLAAWICWAILAQAPKGQ